MEAINSPNQADLYDKPSIPSLPPTPESLPLQMLDNATQLFSTDSSSTDDFSRWRPSFHLLPKNGWLNDPCGLGFDSSSGLYHVAFQWNPYDNDWGNIAWGRATSRDLLNWKVNNSPCLSPDKPYDQCGVFTGCLRNSGTPGEESERLTYIYTSVNALPIHHTLPYKVGCESLSLAISGDSGRTWEKHPDNPIVSSSPRDVTVTGWRDPFVAPWPNLSRLLGQDRRTLYGIVSGGILDKTPTTFLYAIEHDDLSQWTYLGPLVDVGLNHSPSRWSGDLGRNWEVTNFVTLHDENDYSTSREIIIMGTEGLAADRDSSVPNTSGNVQRVPRGQLWMSGMLAAEDAGNHAKPRPKMQYDFGGYLDHGCFYAANSFHDPISQCQIVIGWITEEDLSDELRHRQGWSGLLSLPRQLHLKSMRRVKKGWASNLSSITSFESEKDQYGTYTIRTLASTPDPRVVEKLRRHPDVRRSDLESMPLYCSDVPQFPASKISTKTWELRCTIKVARSCRKVGLDIGHAPDFYNPTSLVFLPSSEIFTIYRPSLPMANSTQLVNSSEESAPHTLLTYVDPETYTEETELLEICAWRDNSVLEVFVNGRTAISTRIYSVEQSSGIQFFAQDDNEGEDRSRVLEATIFDGIGIAQA